MYFLREGKDEFAVAGGQKHCRRSVRAYVKIATRLHSCKRVVSFSVLVFILVSQGAHSWIRTSLPRDVAHKEWTVAYLWIRPWLARSREQVVAVYGGGCGHSGFFSGTCSQRPTWNLGREQEQFRFLCLCTEVQCGARVVSGSLCIVALGHASWFFYVLGFGPWKHVIGAFWFQRSGF